MRRIKRTHQRVNNYTLMSGVMRWLRSILRLITGSKFGRSQRQHNFVPYVESLGQIIPWMFALDHYYYARWMTVHVRDLLTVEVNSHKTHAQFLKGNFVTQKTTHKFSALAHDQIHA